MDASPVPSLFLGPGEKDSNETSPKSGKTGAAKTKLENLLTGVDYYVSRWRCGLDDITSVSARMSHSAADSHKSSSVWQSKDRSKVYSGKGDAIKALLLRNRKAFQKPPEERTTIEIEEVVRPLSRPPPASRPTNAEFEADVDNPNARLGPPRGVARTLSSTGLTFVLFQFSSLYLSLLVCARALACVCLLASPFCVSIQPHSTT